MFSRLTRIFQTSSSQNQTRPQQQAQSNRVIVPPPPPPNEVELATSYLALQERDPRSLTEAKHRQLQAFVQAQESALRTWTVSQPRPSQRTPNTSEDRVTLAPSTATSAQVPPRLASRTQSSIPPQESTTQSLRPVRPPRPKPVEQPKSPLHPSSNWPLLSTDVCVSANIASPPGEADSKLHTNSDRRTEQPPPPPPALPSSSSKATETPPVGTTPLHQQAKRPVAHALVAIGKETQAPRQELSFRELYRRRKLDNPDADPILQNVTIEPQGGDTPFVTELKDVFQKPQEQAKAILRKIIIHRKEGGGEIYVKFPGQKEEITVTRPDLSGGVKSNVLAIPILDAAYRKAHAGQLDDPAKARKAIYGEEPLTSSATAIKPPLPPNKPSTTTKKQALPTFPPNKPSASKAVDTSKAEAKPQPQQTDVSLPTSAASAVRREGIKLGRELTLQELYGSRFRDATIKQGANSNTCFLLSSLDSILHMPDEKAHAILSRIKIYQNGNQYQVKFPGQRDVITVTDQELSQTFTVQSERGNAPWQAQRVDSNALGIKLIEAAYLKTIPSRLVGHIDDPYRALSRIFGEDNELTNIQNSLGHSPDINHYAIGGLTFTNPEECHNYFKELIRITRDPSAKEYENVADILTAIPIREQQTRQEQHNGQIFQYQAPTGDHYYSVRLHDSTPTEIVLFNSLNPNKLITKSFDEFMREYNIEGMRLSLD